MKNSKSFCVAQARRVNKTVVALVRMGDASGARYAKQFVNLWMAEARKAQAK